jgi:hypothetical protein
MHIKLLQIAGMRSPYLLISNIYGQYESLNSKIIQTCFNFKLAGVKSKKSYKKWQIVSNSVK